MSNKEKLLSFSHRIQKIENIEGQIQRLLKIMRKDLNKELKAFAKEREERLAKGVKFKIYIFFCQRCGNKFTERVPVSEGWQPFSLYPCSECGSHAASYLGEMQFDMKEELPGKK